MKYFLVLLAGLVFTLESFSQSSLYQSSSQLGIDLAESLYDQQLFAASLYDNNQLLATGLNLPQQKQAELQRALSALQLERPDGLGLIKKFVQDYAGQPAVASAATFLGNFYFFKKLYSEAIEAFALVPMGLVKKEMRPDVSFKLGFSYFIQKDYAAASSYLDQVKELNLPLASDALYYSGFMAMERGNTQQAIRELQLAEKSEFYAPKVPFLLTSLYYKERKYEDAIAYATPLLASGKSFDQQESIHLFLAESYYALKDFMNASTQYNLFISFKKGELTKEEYYKAGISFFETKNYQMASEFLKLAALGNPDIAQAASYYLGHTYVQLGNFTYALTSFQVASASSIHLGIQEEALFNLAKINLQRGNFQVAVNTLDNYLTGYPQGKRFAEAETLLSDALLNSSEYLRVMEQLDKLKTKSPRLQLAYQKVAYYQALIYYRDQKQEQALAYLTKSQSYPSDRSLLAETHFWKGEIYSAQEALDQAISSYQLVINQSSTSEPYFLKATYGLGYAYFNSQEYGLAEQQFQNYRSSQRNKNKASYQDALLRLGDCHFVQKKFTQAEATFTQGIAEKIAAQDYAHLQLAVVTNYQGKNQAAVEQLNLLIENFPTSVYLEEAFFQKGQIYLEELRYEEAITAFSELIRERPNSPFLPYALEGRAVANYSLQRFSQTQADYIKILEEHPLAENSEAALKGLQEALVVQEKAEEFWEYLQNYKNTDPNAGSVQILEYETAKNLYLSQKFPQAAKALDSYLRNYPESAQKNEALYFAADAYRQVGDVERAFDLFKLMEQQPASPYRIKALQQLGNIELDRENFQEALRYFVPILGQTRSLLAEAEVAKGIMVAHFFMEEYTQAITAANQLLAQEELIPGIAAKALLIKGKSHRFLGQNSESEDSFGLLIQKFSNEEAAEGLFLLALIYQEKGDLKGSNELIFDYSTPFLEFDFWYGSVFLLLADNYLKLGEVFQAKATLQSVIDQSTDATVKEKAASTLKSLD
ncbi:MAG: tetratricopeptide repeat protein [Bacteroidetes bacterium]|nr:tetratricopeptide repeat protein [Bacteroidota bacterium]